MLATLHALGRELVCRWKLRRCAAVGRGVRVRGRVHVHGGGEVRLGARVTLDGARVPIELHAGPGAVLMLEDDVFVGAGASIEAMEAVTIGARTELCELVKVMDNHFHRVHGDRLLRPMSAPIVVEADAELGARSILLPGARIGRGAVVCSAAVVTRPVAAGAIVWGVPAKPRRG